MNVYFLRDRKHLIHIWYKVYSRICTFLSFLLVCSTVYGQDMATAIEELMKRHDFLQSSEVGIVVYDLQTREERYVHQPDKLFRPASVQKIITGVTALATLGENHTYNTQLRYTGDIVNGVLRGNLYVVGDYDAEFGRTDLFRLVEAVRDAGIRKIAGRLYGDTSFSDAPFWGPGWCWDDASSTFMPYMSALILNKGALHVSAYPTSRGKRARIEAIPRATTYEIINETQSKTPKAGVFQIERNWQAQGNTIRLRGNVKTPIHSRISLFDGARYFMDAFQAQLTEVGVSTSGTPIIGSVTPAEARLLSVIERPLTDILIEALKESDNLSAEALFAHIGAYGGGEKTTTNFIRSTRVVKEFIDAELPIDSEELKVADGSGLSPYNLVSPRQLLSFLTYAYDHPTLYNAFYNALPIAGVDGTLKRRMKNGTAFRQVRAKTGTITGISALAGYATGQSGQILAFVILHQNVLRASQARVFQDELCEILTSC